MQTPTVDGLFSDRMVASHDFLGIAPLAPGSGVPVVDGIRVGVGGWTYAPWRNAFYPRGLVTRRELEFASRRFSTIEINGTFYGSRRASEYAQWRMQTPDGFVFSVKAPQHVTQRGPLARCGRSALAFLNGGLAELGDRLGPVLWHMPPSRLFDADDLTEFLELLPRTLDGRPLQHVIEPSHPSFVDPRYLEIARTFDVGTAMTDLPDTPVFTEVTGGVAYLRLMGARVDLPDGYTHAELDGWLKRAHEWARIDANASTASPGGESADLQTRDVYVYFIGGAKQRNPAAAMAMIASLLRA